MRHALYLVALSLVLSACGDDEHIPETPADAASTEDPIGPGAVEPFPELVCPGGPTCEGPGDMTFRVGAARVDITPDLAQHESEWTDENGDNHWEPGEDFVDTNGNNVFDAVWLAGFSNGRPATGVHDPIWVRAIAFEYGDTRIALAVTDTVGWFANDMDAARELLDPGLDLDHVVIASTHVHEVPDTIGLWGSQPLETGLDMDYQQRVRQSIADAVTAAVGALEPVSMTVAEAQTLDVDGNAEPFVSDSRDPVIIDPTMTVMRFAAIDEPTRTVATLVHWAAHPEYFWADNNLITADYVYWIRDIVENGAAENTVRGLPALAGMGGEVVYLNGTIGGLIYPGRAHPIGPDGQPVADNGMAKAEAAGINLGRLALEAITSAEATNVADPMVALRTGRLYLTVENTFYHVGGLVGVFDRPFLGYDMDRPIGPDNLPFLESRISYLEVGNVGIATAPGELFPELAIGGYDGSHAHGFELIDPNNDNPPNLALAPAGPYVKDVILMNEGVEHALIAGMTEDFVGYIPPAYDYVLSENAPYLEDAPGDHYEETNSLGPGVEREIVDTMKSLIAWRPSGARR